MESIRHPYLFASLVFFTLLISLLIAVFPMSPAMSLVRPEFMCLIVLYWSLNTPQHFGIVYAWMAGLTQDIIEGSVWGGHAMALSIISYICIESSQRIRNYSVWHQSLWVFVLVGFHQVIVNWMQGLMGYHSLPFQLVLSSILTAFFWPLIVMGIRRVRVLYRII